MVKGQAGNMILSGSFELNNISLIIFEGYFYFLRGQKYISNITNYILSSSNKIKRIDPNSTSHSCGV
jgi:hypothetical protein